jgi:hypothetical protein
MGLLDKIFGRKQAPRQTSQLAGRNMDVQTDEQKAGTRSRMEAEMQTSRDARDAAPKEPPTS